MYFCPSQYRNQWCKPDPKMNQVINQKLRDINLLIILQEIYFLLQENFSWQLIFFFFLISVL